jgi:hypothetical protein
MQWQIGASERQMVPTALGMTGVVLTTVPGATRPFRSNNDRSRSNNDHSRSNNDHSRSNGGREACERLHLTSKSETEKNESIVC